MAEMEESGKTTSSDTSDVSSRLANVSLSIWPPSQRTRDAVIKRLVETLSSESILSKRYGVVPPDEAVEAATRIEEEAFSVIVASASPDEDGLETLQSYSKEISRRMLDIVKSRSATANSSAAVTDAEPEKKPEEDAAAAPDGDKESSSAVETES